MKTDKVKNVMPLCTVRGIDELGRIVLPKEMRDVLGWNNGDRLEILPFEDGTLLVRKYEPKA